MMVERTDLRSTRAPGAIPTLAQRRLVQAAVLEAPDALAAWEDWQREAAVPELEPDSQWLLPALYVNLRRLGVAEARLGRYAHVYRHNWYKNQMLLSAARPLLEALRAAGESPVLLGGAALAASVYPALGARPIETLALGGVSLAHEHLLALAAICGWQKASQSAPDAALELTDHLGRRCQLRARLMGVEPDALLRSHTQVVRVAGQSLRVLGATDQLMPVLVERTAWDGRSALLWAVDAAHCLRRLGPEGRAAVEHRARMLGCWDEALSGLALLAEDFGLAALAPHGIIA